MHGTNPIRPPLKGDGSTLDVKAVFATLQGEGPYAGWPAVFVRLGGCNLACDFCDTEFEDYAARPLDALLNEIEEKSFSQGKRVRSLIVITGGEPLRQNIAPLNEALLKKGCRVQIETNGTLWRELPEGVDIICSPKNTSGAYAPIRPDLLPRISALKFLLSRRHPHYRSVPELGQAVYNTPVYVQPMDEGDEALNRANTDFAVEVAQTHGYRLSLQLHKMLGIE